MSIALVLGGSQSLWTDVDAALNLGEFDGVVACNDAAAWWPGPLQAAVTYHAEKWPYWLEIRRRKGHPTPERLFGHFGCTQNPSNAEIIPHRFPGQRETGSSGQFALYVALEILNYDKAVLCGIPMNPQGHFFDGDAWMAYSAHRQGWHDAMQHLHGRVKSMSGWTAEQFGKPTSEWIGSKS